jgi:hypothetical protein
MVYSSSKQAAIRASRPERLAQRVAETRFIEEEEAGGSTEDHLIRQRDWLGVSYVNFSTKLGEEDIPGLPSLPVRWDE